MIAQAHSATLAGIEALPIVVEVDLQGGPATFVMVGLPDKAVEESKERVRMESSVHLPRLISGALSSGGAETPSFTMDLKDVENGLVSHAVPVVQFTGRPSCFSCP